MPLDPLSSPHHLVTFSPSFSCAISPADSCGDIVAAGPTIQVQGLDLYNVVGGRFIH
jgi:hypothetical protein